MLVSLVFAAAVAAPPRHVIQIDVSVTLPTTADAEVPPLPEAPVDHTLASARVPRWVPSEGEVALTCDSQTNGTGDFVEAQAVHRPRMYVRDGVLHFEHHPSAWPETLGDWPAVTCAYDTGLKHIEWTTTWAPVPPTPESAAANDDAE